MKLTKNLILSIMLASGLTLNSSHSDAAIIVAATSGAAVPVLALLVAGTGGGFAATYLIPNHKKGVGVGILIFTAGVLLDKESQEITFTEINKSEAAAAGLSDNELEAYNSELVRINASTQEMNSALKNANKEEMATIANSALENFKSDISADAFNALSKISRANFKVN